MKRADLEVGGKYWYSDSHSNPLEWGHCAEVLNLWVRKNRHNYSLSYTEVPPGTKNAMVLVQLRPDGDEEGYPRVVPLAHLRGPYEELRVKHERYREEKYQQIRAQNERWEQDRLDGQQVAGFLAGLGMATEVSVRNATVTVSLADAVKLVQIVRDARPNE